LLRKEGTVWKGRLPKFWDIIRGRLTTHFDADLQVVVHHYIATERSIKSIEAKVAQAQRDCVPAQPEMESGRSPLVSIPPFGRGFSRHGGLSIRCGLLKSAEAGPPRSGHRLDEPARLSLGRVASQQSPLPFRLAEPL
jgi:hypothetical protein